MALEVRVPLKVPAVNGIGPVVKSTLPPTGLVLEGAGESTAPGTKPGTTAWAAAIDRVKAAANESNGCVLDRELVRYIRFLSAERGHVVRLDKLWIFVKTFFAEIFCNS